MIQQEIPPKPFFENKPTNNLTYSIVSICLFIGVFYWVISKDIKFILILTLAILIHELGHYIVMKFYGYKDLKIFFIPLLGAFVAGKKKEISQTKRALILLAGPIPGIIIGIVFFIIGSLSENQNLIMIAYIFMFLNAFNLLPLIPLDGGNLLTTLFFNKKEQLQLFFMIISIIGISIIAFFLKTYLLLIIPFFMLINIKQQLDNKKVIEILKKKNINYEKDFNDLTDEEYWLIREQIVTNIQIFKNVDGKEYKISKQEKLIKKQIESLVIESPTQDLSMQSKLIYLFIWCFFLIIPLIMVQNS